jgi:hypothetical protein
MNAEMTQRMKKAPKEGPPVEAAQINTHTWLTDILLDSAANVEKMTTGMVVRYLPALSKWGLACLVSR